MILRIIHIIVDMHFWPTFFLLQNEISDQDIIDKDFNDIVDELYSDDTIIFIYKKV